MAVPVRVLSVLRLEVDVLNISRDYSILVYFVLLKLLSTFLHVGRVQISLGSGPDTFFVNNTIRNCITVKKVIFKNYWMRLSRILRIIQPEDSVISEADADNADRGLNNSDILRKPNSIILLLFISHEKSAIRIQIKSKKFLNFFLLFFVIKNNSTFEIHAKYR